MPEPIFTHGSTADLDKPQLRTMLIVVSGTIALFLCAYILHVLLG